MRTDPKQPTNDELDRPVLSQPPKLSQAAQSSKLSAVVRGRDNHSKPWSETAEITSLSSSGVGFFVSRACEAGRLVSLIMPMPSHMRKYDQDKRLYRVWGLIQYCYEAGGEESSGFHVGAALIGKDAPENYSNRPNQCYRILGIDRNGLWKVEELDGSFKQRASIRYWNSIEVFIYQLDRDQETIAVEKTVTENISETGASVLSDLRVAVGDQIKFKTVSLPFSSISVVRQRRVGQDDRSRIHIEFIENTFPVLELETPNKEDLED